MGVKGLCSLLEDYRQIYQDVRFWNSKLVVDGSSLAHLLHNMANLDQNHGGGPGFLQDSGRPWNQTVRGDGRRLGQQ